MKFGILLRYGVLMNNTYFIPSNHLREGTVLTLSVSLIFHGGFITGFSYFFWNGACLLNTKIKALVLRSTAPLGLLIWVMCVCVCACRHMYVTVCCHCCSWNLQRMTVSVSAQDGIVALRKAHTRSALSLSSLPKVGLEQCQYLPGWTQIVLDLGGWNVGRFLSPLLFPSGDQCCDALVCLYWESSSNLGAPLPCQAADQMWYLLCLPVYLPVHSHWLQHAQDSRSTEVFVAKDCDWLCASRGSPFQTPSFAGGSLSLWEWWHV